MRQDYMEAFIPMNQLPGLEGKENEFNEETKGMYGTAFTEVFMRARERSSNENELLFDKEELEGICNDLGLDVKNIPDIKYQYQVGRAELPDEIRSTGNWVVQGRGKGKYAFVRITREPFIEIPADLHIIEVPDATPDIVLKYGGEDEQAVLSRVRYNRLVDIFLSITAYHLQGHFRSAISEIGQVEIDDLYLGVDQEGSWYVIPIEAKGPGQQEKLSVIQIQQMILFAKQDYPRLLLRPIGIKSLGDGSSVFAEFNDSADLEEISVKDYKRYRLIRDDTK